MTSGALELVEQILRSLVEHRPDRVFDRVGVLVEVSRVARRAHLQSIEWQSTFINGDFAGLRTLYVTNKVGPCTGADTTREKREGVPGYSGYAARYKEGQGQVSTTQDGRNTTGKRLLLCTKTDQHLLSSLLATHLGNDGRRQLLLQQSGEVEPAEPPESTDRSIPFL